MTDLLFLTPTLPFPTGHGSAMRASVALEVLAETHRVFVLNTNQWGIKQGFDEGWVRQRAAGYAVVPPRPDEAAVRSVSESLFLGAQFAQLHVFRLGMAPLAIQVMSHMDARPELTVLDLDDNEVERSERFLQLLERSGDTARAAVERAQLAQFRAFTRVLVPRFDIVLLATDRDREAFQAQFPTKRFVHLPNTVRPAKAIASRPNSSRLLFVASLDYLPNEDGIVNFCEAVLPIIRDMGIRSTVRVVGGGAGDRVAALARNPEVQLAGFVPELAAEYARAGAAIVPLRAGSGSRIKILEAISYGCPVVSTPIGAEGLGLKHEEHCLLAEAPAEFASACRRLMIDGKLRNRLIENALAWLKETHSVQNARSVLHDVFSSCGAAVR